MLYDKPICLAENEYLGRDLILARMPDGQAPFAFIEIRDSYVAVEFLDDFIRSFMNYQYQEIEPGRLFLSMAVRRHFLEDTNDVADGMVWFFKQDGSVTIEDDERRWDSSLDVSGQWKSYPAFGQYDDLLKVNWGRLTDGNAPNSFLK